MPRPARLYTRWRLSSSVRTVRVQYSAVEPVNGGWSVFQTLTVSLHSSFRSWLQLFALALEKYPLKGSCENVHLLGFPRFLNYFFKKCLIRRAIRICLSSIRFLRFIPYALSNISSPAWLSVFKKPGASFMRLVSVNMRAIAFSCRAQHATEIYSLSAVDMAIKDCVFLTQYMGELVYVMATLVVDLRSVRSPRSLHPHIFVRETCSVVH